MPAGLIADSGEKEGGPGNGGFTPYGRGRVVQPGRKCPGTKVKLLYESCCHISEGEVEDHRRGPVGPQASILFESVLIAGCRVV